MRPSDEEILSLTKVTPVIAGLYLGISDDKVREGLISGDFPFGTAIKSESGRYVYDIRPEALIHYNRHGKGIDVVQLAEVIVKLMKGA